MIKSLREARITDALPRVLAAQDWVRAFSEALGALQEKTLDFTDGSQIYTAIDDVPETVLNALAVNWKIDWYDTDYSVEKKRRLVKTAMAVRRLMGTVAATRMQADAVYPGTMLEEWFDYSGKPGCFRLYVDITNSTEEEPVIAFPQDEMERRLVTAKRWSAHLESLSYMVRRGLIIRHAVKGWAYNVPYCGTIRCGTWWMPSTLGWSEHRPLVVSAKPEAFAVSPELAGTLPDVRTAGWSVSGTVLLAGRAEGFADRLEYAGTVRSGTAAVPSTVGWSEHHSIAEQADAEPFTAAPELAGTLPDNAVAGYSLVCGGIRTSGAAAGFTGLPEPAGTGTPAGRLPGTATVGYVLTCGTVRAGGVVQGYGGQPELAGTLPDNAAAGYSLVCGGIHTDGAAAGFTGLPEPAGTGTPAGRLPGAAVAGYALTCGTVRASGTAQGYTIQPEYTGTLPEEAQNDG